MSTATTAPVLGDLELEEIMAAVGADFGSTPVPPVAKEKPAVEEPKVEVPEVEVPDLDAIEADAEKAPVATESLSSEEVIDKVMEQEDEELAALLASVPDVTPGDPIVVTDEPVDEIELTVEEAVSSVAETVEPEPEAKVEIEIKAPTIPVVEPKVTTESDDETLLSSPYEDDDDFKPVTKNGVTYYIDPARLKRDVAFSTVNIDEAMMTHASMYVHYGVQQSKARGQYERTKAAFEILESRLDNEHRVALKEENPKTTEAQIRAAVVSDERWKRGNARLIETRGVYDLASVALEAFSQRRDTLLQMAKTLREEQSSRMRLEEIREGTKAAAGAVVERMKEKSKKAAVGLGSEPAQV